MDKRFYPSSIILNSVLVVITTLTLSGSVAAETVAERLLKLFDSSGDQAAVGDTFLEPDQAFRFTAIAMDRNRVNLIWQIEPGYYLYHDKFSVSIINSDSKITLGAPVIPDGEIRADESFGSMEVNIGDVVIDVPVQIEGTEDVSLTLQVGYQGCKENSICYPPIKRQVPLVLAGVPAGDNQ